MAQKQETIFRAKFVALLKRLPSIKVFSIQQLSISGDPDLLICCNGHFIGVELKKGPNDAPSALQEQILSEIEGAGGTIFVCHPGNMNAVYSAIYRLTNGGINNDMSNI